MAKELTNMWCPLCDRQEHGQTQSRLLNKQSGYVCSGQGHKFPNYIQMMAMKPRMEKLVIQEKQPPGASIHPMWIHPEALSALQTRFPTNFRTTIYSLFNALAGGAILVEKEHAVELRELGITKGVQVAGLAKTNLALTEQIRTLQDQLKQYEMLSRLMAVAQGGQANSPAAQSPVIDAMLNPTPERPPQQPVQPIIDTDADSIFEPVAPGSFSDGAFGSPVSLPPLPPRPPGMPKPQPAVR